MVLLRHILLITIVPVCLAMALLAGVVELFFQRSERDIQTQIENKAQALVGSFGTLHQQIALITESIATSPNVASAVVSYETTELVEIGEGSRVLGLDYLAYMDPQGEVMAQVHDPYLFGFNYPLHEAYGETLPDKPIHSIQRINGKWYLTALVPIESINRKRLGYVQGGKVLSPKLADILADPIRSHLELRMGDNVSLAQSTTALDVVGEDPVDVILFKFRQHTLIARMSVPMGSARATLNRFHVTTYALAFGVLLLAIGLAWFGAHQISQPLKDLRHTMQQYVKDRRIDRSPKAQVETLIYLAELFDIIRQEDHHRLEDLAQHTKTLSDSVHNLTALNHERGHLLSKISHEIRTPLNGVLGTLDVLQQNAQTAPIQEELDMLRQSTETLVRIVDDVAGYSQIEAGQLTLKKDRLDLNTLVTSVISACQQEYSTSAVTVTKDWKDLPTNLKGDSKRLRQILHNLIHNAYKFTKQGNIHVSLSLTFISDHSCALECSIKDTGHGIAKDKLPFLFDRFANQAPDSESTPEGTGLGLAITKRLINAMGGEIDIKSEENKGTTATFHVRLHRDKENIENPADNDTQLHWTGHVAVVEDHPISQLVMKKLLEQLGCRVSIHGLGQSLLDAMDQNPHPDVVFMDIQLPVLSGTQCTRALRRSGFSHPIIGITANAIDAETPGCIEAGMQDVIFKPVSRSTLISVLNQFGPRPQEG